MKLTILLALINVTVIAGFSIAADKEIVGYADLHSHIVANKAYGETLFHGEAFHEDGIASALPSCSPLHGKDGSLDQAGNLIFRGFGKRHGNTPFSKQAPWPSRTNQNHQQMHVDWIGRLSRIR